MSARTRLLLAIAAIVVGASPVRASFNQCATNWDNFNNPGFIVEYTYRGLVIADEEAPGDGSHGAASVPPASTDLASGSPGTFPGPAATSFFGYYDGGTVYDPDDPATMEDDVILFRMRVEGDPTMGAAFDSRHWNVLVDLDGDGYKEYWVDLDGSFGSGQQVDRLQILYDDANRQDISNPDAARVEVFTARHTAAGAPACTGGSPGLSHTRAIQVNDGTPDWWIDIQVPITAFDDLAGNQVLFPDSPVAFVFSTGASNQDPLQKDFMQDLDFLTLVDPITFGDVVTPNGAPHIELTDASFDSVSTYRVGDEVFVTLTDPASNTDPNDVECIEAVVTNPSTGDDEMVLLCESGPGTGIFTNRGGSCAVEITSPSPAPSPPTAWLVGLRTSASSVDETWTLTYMATANRWEVAGSVSGTQPTFAFRGFPYRSTTGGISFTLYHDEPTNGTVLSFCTRAADPLLTSSAGGTDDDGTLQVFSGDDIFVSYTNPRFITVTDWAVILGPCEASVLFTRASGLPADRFQLTPNPSTSDRLYVTVVHDEANTNPATVQTLTVVLTGNDTQSLTLIETGPDTGEFRNTTGLQAKIDDGVVAPNDGLWEDVDTGVVTATYNYDCGGTFSRSTEASLFHSTGGRIEFVNGAGTQDLELYGANSPIWLQVIDPSACTVLVGGARTLQVAMTSAAGDSETVTLYETFTGSGVFRNQRGDLVTTAGSGVVMSASSTFVTDAVQAGDPFAIASGPDLGLYTIASVDSQTQITLTTALTASRTGIAFSAQPLLTASDDGALAADDQVLEAGHEDTLTASYGDCNDGDLDGTNDVKTDTALYNAPPLLINEVLFYPDTAASSCQTEAVELTNASAVPVTATGYTITDEDGFSYVIPALAGSSIVLQPGELIYLSLWNANPPNDFFLNGTYFLFMEAGTTYPSDRFADPASTDPADQVTLLDPFGVVQDYVGWSSTLSPSLDFFGDDASAVLRAIWQDDSFRNAAAIGLSQSMARTVNGFDTNRPTDWSFVSNDTCQIIVTRAFVSSFRAFREGGRIVTEWETGSQSGTAGFYLYRLDEGGEGYVPVNTLLVPARLDAAQGGLYRVLDPGARGETLSYVLMEVETGPSGTTHRFHGPYTIRVEEGDDLSRASRVRGATEESFIYAVSGGERPPLDVPIHRPRSPSPDRRVSGPPRAKIAVESEGLYALSTVEIASAFGLPEQAGRQRLQSGSYRLSNRGRSVAWTASPDGSKLLFWGEAIESIYTKENVYWLEEGRGLEMPRARRERATGGAGGSSFRYTAHFEEDAFAATLVATDPELDYWHWTYVSSGHPTFGRARLTVSLSGLADSSGESRLAVHLVSATDTSAGDRLDHHVKVRVNGAAAGEARWGGIRAHTLEAAVATSLLREGDNVIEIEGLLDAGAPFSVFYVDSVDVTYPRRYHATESTFVFRADGSTFLEVTGFPEPGVTVLDVTEPTRPARVDASVDEAGDGYVVRFASSPDGIYAAISSSGMRSPLRLRPDRPSTLRSASRGFDYVVIAPPELEEGAARLAELRESSGLSATVVSLEDVMDEFQEGISTPHAIRQFLAHAHERWSKPPRFAVLAGAGDLDYKGRYGLGGNLIPPLMASTPNGLFASDNRFGDVDGDGWPELSVGRIPATTAAQMNAYVDKLAGFEASGMSLWSDSILMVADDDPWTRSSFDRHSESMASRVPASSSLQRIYLGTTGAGRARTELLAGLSRGAALFNYVGHGGLDRIADEMLLRTSDVKYLQNGTRAGVVAGLSCSINRFEIAGLTSLGEALTLEPTGGATAVWAPSGLSLDFEAFRLGNAFFRAVFDGAAPTLGDAIRTAFDSYREGGGIALTPAIYNLLGDPAVRLK